MSQDNTDNGAGYVPERGGDSQPARMPDGQLNYPTDNLEFS